MNLESVRGEFRILAFAPDDDLRNRMDRSIAAAGYDVQVHSVYDRLMVDARNQPPHVLVFQNKNIEGEFKDFFEEILTISPETIVIGIGLADDFEVLKRFALFGLYDFIISDEQFEEKVVWALERACQQIYYRYQCEQLYSEVEELREGGSAKIEAGAEMEGGENDIVVSEEESAPLETLAPAINFADGLQIVEYVSDLENAAKEEVASELYLEKIFVASEKKVNGIFFTYYPNLYSLVGTQSIGLSIDRVRGMGIKLNGEQAKNFQDSLVHILENQEFLQLLYTLTGADQFECYPVYGQRDISGVVVHWGELGSFLSSPEIKSIFSIYQSQYKYKKMQKLLSELETKDYVTKAYNLSYFMKSLSDEVSRARRLSLSVSVIRIEVDGFEQYQSQFGEENGDILLKNLVGVINKTSRVNDVVARVGPSEFAIIAAHTGYKGASIRSERLRRIIEASPMNIDDGSSGQKVTVSLGVSEFPSLSTDADDVFRSSESALRQVRRKGGNKVCLATVESGFKPEFLPKE